MSGEFYEVGNSFVNKAEGDRKTEAALSKAGGSWLVAIAMIMGQMADRMGGDLVKLAQQIDDQMAAKSAAETAVPPRAFKGNLTELNAYMQANTQLMNTFMQAINTVIKSIGEGVTGVSKKN